MTHFRRFLTRTCVRPCLLLLTGFAGHRAVAQLQYDPEYEFTVFAGAINDWGTADGTGTAARFNGPAGLALDTAGNLYVADANNHTIRKITPAGVVTTVAGMARNPGHGDGVGLAAQFHAPEGIAIDLFQNLYVTETGGYTLRRIATYGGASGLMTWGPFQVWRMAGDPRYPVLQDGPLATAMFDRPRSVAVANGNQGNGGFLVIAENSPYLRKVTPGLPLSQFAPELGSVSRLAGSAFLNPIDGTGSSAWIGKYGAIAADATGTFWFADNEGSMVRRVSSSGIVTTIAGSRWQEGAVDGTGSAARFRNPSGIAVEPAGATGGWVYVADTGNGLVRRVGSTSGTVTTLAGATNNPGPQEGRGSRAGFGSVSAIATDGQGTLYVADRIAHVIWKGVRAGLFPVPANAPRILRPPVSRTAELRASAEFRPIITPSNSVTTTYQWHLDGAPIPGATAFFHYISIVEPRHAGTYTVTATNADGRVTSRPAILTVVPSTIHYGPRLRVTTFAGSTLGTVDGSLASAQFRWPRAVAFDRNRNLYVVDSSAPVVRKITPEGVVSTLAGSPTSVGQYADGVGSAARFSNLAGVAVDAAGNVFVSDSSNNSIRRITPSGVVTTFAGSPRSPGARDGTGTAASFDGPENLVFDRAGNLYVVDSRNDTLRKITPGGVVTTLAGKAYTGAVNSSTDGTGSAAHFYGPRGLTIDGADNLYVADTSNGVIRRVTLAGVVTTVAGLARNPGMADGKGSDARFYAPVGIAADLAGNLYVSDRDTIRRVTREGVVTTVAGLRDTVGNEDGDGSQARLRSPQGLAVDRTDSGDLFIAEGGNARIRRARTILGDEPGPAIQAAPDSQNAAPGARVVFTVQATSSTAMTYQWYWNDRALGGETGSSLVLNGVNAGYNGSYHVVVTNLFGSTRSAAAVLTVGPPAGRITNLSILAELTPEERSFKIGTVLGGEGTRGNKPIVVRAVGPALATFGLSEYLADPALTIAAGSADSAPVVAANDNWGGTAALRQAMSLVGAFEFPSADSKDAAVAPSLAAGDYVVEVLGREGGTGKVLAELYDATTAEAFTPTTPRLINVSLLKRLGSGIVAGFVIGGEGSRAVLVRAVGPGLAPFGLSGTLSNPQVALFNGQGDLLQTNDNWGGTAELTAGFRQVGAFPLETDSLDAALIARLTPGNYTVSVTGRGDDTGPVLVEIYEVPGAP
ncbi:MAG: hypothetical protein HZC55_05760 [Verrucomicrobia bacterium]|nr:hypothetical protein [Verrucomicrobiota bacterium]